MSKFKQCKELLGFDHTTRQHIILYHGCLCFINAR